MRHVPAALFATIAMASPAAAQIWDGGGAAETRAPVVPAGIGPSQRQIGDNIRDGRHSGALSRREARSLKRESRHIDTLAERYRQDGLSASELRELDFRAAALHSFVNARRTQSGK